MRNSNFGFQFTAGEIHDAYMRVHGGYLPCSLDVVVDFMRTSAAAPLLAKSQDLKYLVNLLQDYVGSTMSYEEGSEEAW